MITSFLKPNTYVEAIRYNNLNRDEISEFVKSKVIQELESETAYLAGVAPPICSVTMITDRCTLKVFPGEWIVKETYSPTYHVFYMYTDKIFQSLIHQSHSSNENS